MKLVTSITPQNRMDKTKSFAVDGEANINESPDIAYVHMMVDLDEDNINACQRSMDTKIDRIKSEVKRYFMGDKQGAVEVKVWGSPKFENIIQAYKKENVSSPVGNSLDFMGGGEVAMDGQSATYFKKNPVYRTHMIQNLTLDVSDYFSSPSEIVKLIAQLQSFTSARIVTKSVVRRMPRAGEGKRKFKGGGGDDSDASQDVISGAGEASAGDVGVLLGEDGNIKYGFKKETVEVLKKKVIAAAVEDAKKKAGSMAKSLGIPIDGITPLIEEKVTFGSQLDDSRETVITGKVTLYF